MNNLASNAMDLPNDRLIDLPTAPDAELALLACLIENPKRFGPKAWESGIGPDFFTSEGNASLFSILTTRIREDKPVDPSSIRQEIRANRPPGLTATHMLEIINCEKSQSGWDGYLDAIRDAHSRRILILAGNAAATVSGHEALAEIRRATERASAAISGQTEIMDSKRALDGFFNAFQERNQAGVHPGLPTGIVQFDRHTGGMRAGELWVVGAKTSGGKSILMLQMAEAAILEGKRVAIFSLELGVEEVVGRLISLTRRVPVTAIMNPKSITKAQMTAITDGVEILKGSNIMVCDTPDMTIDTISGHCIRIKETGGLDLVLIDYLQMVTATKAKGQSREQEVAGISRACKQLAKRLKCPILTATQLNDNGQSRESRAIEHDADNVLLIMDDENGDHNSKLITFWKCRNGQRGTSFQAMMDGLHQRFVMGESVQG